ncbi:hypothetical protein D3C79_686520 [compost metagenome]
MDDLAARVLAQKHFGQQADHVVAFDEAPLIVEEEAAVKVAVECDTHVCAGFQHCLAGKVTVFWQQRVGDAVGEVAIWLAVDDGDIQRQAGLE